jgi:hypothetical protein
VESGYRPARTSPRPIPSRWSRRTWWCTSRGHAARSGRRG